MSDFVKKGVALLAVGKAVCDADGLGGAGIWWPDLSEVSTPLHANEVSCTMHAWSDKGLSLWGALFGPLMSSTRAEIAGGLLTLSAPCATSAGATGGFGLSNRASGIKVKREKIPK